MIQKTSIASLPQSTTQMMIFVTLVVAMVAVSADTATITLHRRPDFNVRDIIPARHRARDTRITGAGFPLSGDLGPAGYVTMYYAKVALGSPPQVFHVQIDTGSDLSWVSCTGCTSCPNHTSIGIQLNYYNVSKSSTGSRLTCSDYDCSCSTESDTCTYTAMYYDGSVAAGYLVSDVLHLHPINWVSDSTSAPLRLGCATSRGGNLAAIDGSVDGIIGLGRGGGSLIQQLSSYGSTSEVFSHCFGGDGGDGGQLVFGEAIHPTMQYNPFVDNGMPFYTINLEAIGVNGSLLPDSVNTDPNKGMTIDTGTTFAFFEEKDYEAVTNAIFSYVQDLVRPDPLRGNNCYDMTASDLDHFPVITLHFLDNAVMDLNPKHYLSRRVLPDGSEIWCVGIRKVEQGGLPTLGELLLRDKIFVYDLHRERLGWSAELNCSFPLSIINVTTNDGCSLSTGNHVWVASVLLSIILVIIFH